MCDGGRAVVSVWDDMTTHRLVGKRGARCRWVTHFAQRQAALFPCGTARVRTACSISDQSLRLWDTRSKSEALFHIYPVVP